MGNIIWLATYPKSGTTWIRSLFTAIKNSDNQVDINSLSTPSAANRYILDNRLGIETSELNREQIRKLLPALFNNWSQEPNPPHFIKTHDALVKLANGELIFPLSATRGVVQIVRDPRDIAVSAHHYFRISQDEAIDLLNDRNRWILNSQPGLQIPTFLSDWSSHTQSWLDSPAAKITIRYEDLLANTVDTFSDILRFCNLDASREKIESAVDACSFSKLQTQEKEKGYSGHLSTTNSLFFRTGKSGSWQNSLTSVQVDRIQNAHETMMIKMGYQLI